MSVYLSERERVPVLMDRRGRGLIGIKATGGVSRTPVTQRTPVVHAAHTCHAMQHTGGAADRRARDPLPSADEQGGVSVHSGRAASAV